MNTSPDWRNLRDYSSLGQDGQEPDVSLFWYAVNKLTPDLLVAVTVLFYPKFLIHRDGVFIADRFSPSVFDAWNRGRYRKDLTAIERVMNHVHLAESLRHGFLELNCQNLCYVGEVMVQTWSAALSHDFPGRVFGVEGVKSDAGYSAGSCDYVITFWQKR